MRHFSEVYRHLRRKNWRQYALLAGCTFFSVLLITAYACMMRSPTVLTILPEALRGFDDYRMLIYAIVLILVMLATNNAQAKALLGRIIPKRKGAQANG